jgi:hypothetical protein
MGKDPPDGVKSVKEGVKSAYRSIQTTRGKGLDTDFNMGIVQVGVRQPSAAPGRPGAITFKPRIANPRQTKSTTRKVGKFYFTPGAGLSRKKPDGRMI